MVFIVPSERFVVVFIGPSEKFVVAFMVTSEVFYGGILRPFSEKFFCFWWDS